MASFTKGPLFLLFLILLTCKYSEKKENIITKLSDENQATTQKDTIKKRSLFTLIPPEESGVNFININSESDIVNFYNYEYFYNGGGVAVADFNNDGLVDIFFTANMSPNRLYINAGDFKFNDVTSSANVNTGENNWCTGVSIVDINNDGWNDIFISRSGWFKNNQSNLLRNLLFINNGNLTFTEQGLEYGFSDLSPTTQTCFFDADNDGDLDAYQINHPTIFKSFKMYKNGDIDRIVSKENDFSDRFYENIEGRFVDKTKSYGLLNSGHGLGVISSDFNNDGWQDLYISNDYAEPDYILMNQKNKTFKNEMLSSFKHISKFSMGVDVADINNDGFQDIFNAEMLAKDNLAKKANMASMNPSAYWFYVNSGFHYQDMHNSLQLNNGNGTFSEIAWLSNLAESEWSWSPLIADFDNDGFKDLFVSNGFKRDIASKDSSKKISDMIRKEGGKRFSEFVDYIPTKKVSNYIFKNNTDLTFTDKTNNWGLKIDVNSNGAAYGDFDNDGDLDLVVSNINDPAMLFRNNQSENNFIDLKLYGKLNMFGSKVEILDSESYQKLEMTSTRGYQSTSDSRLHFGIGKRTKIDSLLITWPNKKQTVLTNLEINKQHDINYDVATFIAPKKPQKIKTLFINQTKAMNVNYVHMEQEYDDYKSEILLPHKLSQEGPHIDVADVNGDGLEDFYVGNGVGFSGELYVQNTTGKFTKSNQNVFTQDKLCEDLGVLFFDYDQDGDKDLYVVSGSNEHSLDSPYMQDRLYSNDGNGNFTKTVNVLPVMPASGYCVKASDFDKDGDLDLFVGGFLIPQQYPKSGSSYLLLNDNGTFKDVTNSMSKDLQHIGMVKDAKFMDINNDGLLDLLITGQWMALELFINTGTQFERKTNEFGLSEHVGWWNTIHIEDINKDGYMDIIAGNLGLNSKHKASKDEPFKIYAKDFDNSGTNDVVLGYYNEGTLYPVRGKQCSSEQLPSISEKVKSYNEFGKLSLEQIYGNNNLYDAISYDATIFSTSIFMNENGNSFTMSALPNETQFAPTNSIVSMDVNADGLNDLMLVGNHHPVEVETGRYDAHIGNVLIRESDQTYKNKPLIESGFFADKDNRDLKRIKIKDKEYLIIASNRDRLQFYQLKP